MRNEMMNGMRDKDNLYDNKVSYKKRKSREFTRKFVFSIMTALFVIVFVGSVFSMNAKANSSKGAADYKYYANYCIVPGDTLWNIAEANIDYNHYGSVKEYAKVFFASTFWTKLQNIFGHYCKSKLEKVAKPRLAAILPAA